MLRPDIAVTKLQCLAKGEFKNLLDARCEGRRSTRVFPCPTNRLFHGAPRGLDRDIAPQKRLSCDPFVFVDESEQDVLSTNEGVVEQPRFLLGQNEHPPGSVGEALKHGLILVAIIIAAVEPVAPDPVEFPPPNG